MTKLLKVIKEKENIAKNKSINETIRDEVAAEIEEQRKKKSKQKYRKREEKRKDREERRKVGKRKRKISCSDSSESSKKPEDFRLPANEKAKNKVQQEERSNSFKNGSAVSVSVKPQVEKQQVPKVVRETPTMSEIKSESEQTEATSKTQLKPVPKLIKVDHSTLVQKSAQIAKTDTTDTNSGNVKSVSVTNNDNKVAKNKEQVIGPASASSEQVNSSSTATSVYSSENKSYKKIDINAYKERKRLKEQTQLKGDLKNNCSTSQDTSRVLPTSKLDSDKLDTKNETMKPETSKVQSKDRSLIGDQNKEVSKRESLREEKKPIARKDKESLFPLQSNSGDKNSSLSVVTNAKSKECGSDKKSSSQEAALEIKKSAQNKSKSVVQKKEKQSKKLISFANPSKPIRSEGKKELKLKEMKNTKRKMNLKLDKLKFSKKKKTSESKQNTSVKRVIANTVNSELKIKDKPIRKENNSLIEQNQESVNDNERSTDINKTIEKNVIPRQQIVDQTENFINSKDEDGNKKIETKVLSKELHLRINVDIEKSGPSINIKSLTNNSVLATESKVSETNDVKQNERSESLLSTNFNIHDKIAESVSRSPDSLTPPCKDFFTASAVDDIYDSQVDTKDPKREENSPFSDTVIRHDVASENNRSTGISEAKKDDITEKRSKPSSEGNQHTGDTKVSEKGNELNVSHKYYRIVDKKSTQVKLHDADLEDCITRDTDFFADKSSDKVNPGDVTSTSSANFKEVFAKDNADKEDLAEGKEKCTLSKKETTIKEIDTRQNPEFGVRPNPCIDTETATVPIVSSVVKLSMEFAKLDNDMLMRQIPTLHGKDALISSIKEDEAASKLEQKKKDKSLHNVRHRSKMKHKKKLKPAKEMIKKTVMSNMVKVGKYSNIQEGIMARMIEIDVEIHKLMSEKMTLYQMLTKDHVLLSNNNNLKGNVIQDERKSDAPRSQTPIESLSSTQEKMKSNGIPATAENSSVIETSINVGEPSKSKAENKNSYISACVFDNVSETRPISRKERQRSKVRGHSTFPKIVLLEKKRTDLNEADAADLACTDVGTKLVKDSSQDSGDGTNFGVVVDKMSTKSDNKDQVSDDKSETLEQQDDRPVVEGIAEEKLKDIDNNPIRDNAERVTNGKGADANCSEIRPSIYSDDSTLDSLPQHADGTKERKKASMGLTLLEETYKKEIARTRKIKRAAARKRKKESRIKMSKVTLTEQEEKLPLSVLYVKKRKNRKHKVPDSMVIRMDDDVLKKMDDVINAVAENRTEKLYAGVESTEETASSDTKRNVESKRNEGERTLKKSEEPPRELLRNKHFQRDTKTSGSYVTPAAKIDEIESLASQILKNDNVGTTIVAEDDESCFTKTNADDKDILTIRASVGVSNTAEVGDENPRPIEDATNSIEKVREYSTSLNNGQRATTISETAERDSKLMHDRKSNEKDNKDTIALQSNCKTKNEQFISLRNHKESHKAREMVKALSEENDKHDCTSASSVIKNTETSKNNEELGKKLNKRKRENTRDTVRQRSKYEGSVKKRTKSETSANSELEEQYKCLRAQGPSSPLSLCEEVQSVGTNFAKSRVQKRKRNNPSETDATYPDNEWSKAIGKQKLHTISEMMSCVVKVIDCRRSVSNSNVNLNVSRSYRISRADNQPKQHSILAPADSSIISQKESAQDETSKAIKRSDDQTDFAAVKRPKSAKVESSDKEKSVESDIEVMPVLTKEEFKENDSHDILDVDEKTITKNQESGESPLPMLTVIDTTDDKELPRTQYTVHNGPILDIKVKTRRVGLRGSKRRFKIP